MGSAYRSKRLKEKLTSIRTRALHRTHGRRVSNRQKALLRRNEDRGGSVRRDGLSRGGRLRRQRHNARWVSHDDPRQIMMRLMNKKSIKFEPAYTLLVKKNSLSYRYINRTFFSSAYFEAIFSSVSLSSSLIHVWVEFKACKWEITVL